MAKKRIHRPEGSRPLESRHRRAPNPRSDPSPAPAQPTSRRLKFENASRPVLRRMQALPPYIIPIALGLLLFFGLTLQADWAGILLLIITLFLAWLAALSWPTIGGGSRALRVVVALAVAGLGVMKLLDVF